MKTRSNKQISSAWLKRCCDEEAKKEVRLKVYGSFAVLDMLNEIIKDNINNTKGTNKHDYDSPSWAYKAADKAGYMRALNDIKTIITLEGMNV